MEMEITLPDEVPVMTLPNVVFFPQALMPLHIFEPRYRQMLKEVLAHDRLFAVAGVNPQLAAEPSQFEPPHRIATLGIVRACQGGPDGTSNLLLQGLCRVELLQILSDEPYRRVRIRPLASELGDPDTNRLLRRELARLLNMKQKLGESIAPELRQFLRTIDDPEAFVDIAAFNLCESSTLKQKLLETLNLQLRLQLFVGQLQREVEAIKLRRRLQGRLADDDVSHN